MSYCRFRNTIEDLIDCKNVLGEIDELSPEEAKARREIIKLCEEIANEGWVK